MPFHGPAVTRPDPIDSPLALGLARAPQELALRDLRRSLSWAELERATEQLARAYRALGLGPGDRLASLVPNGVELVVHYLAGLRSGLVLTPLNYRYVPAEIDHALAVSGAAALVFHRERQADVAASALAGGLPLGTIEFDDPCGFEALLERCPGSDAPWPVLPGDAPCVIYFTSGSTAKPKGVTHSRASLGALLASLAQALELRPGEQVLAGCSLAHVAASALCLGALGAGAGAVIANAIDSPSVETLLRRHRPEVLLMLPAPLFGLVRDGGLQRQDLASVRLCISGGDKVPHQLQQEFQASTGFCIHESYGLTECAYATLAPPSQDGRIGSVGPLSPGLSGSIRNPEGQEVERGEAGRLWLRAPSVMTGYWANPAATADSIQDGWLDSGDEMRLDGDANLWFCGRRKQIIVHDGSNICPQDVEEALAEHPAVALAGVVGIRDPLHGENVRAYVALRPGQPAPAAAELIAFARQRVGYKAPEEICFLPALPLNPVGKIDRIALGQLAQGDTR
ncbi:class I adenylate-forming enzyme family protein [Cyanobium sp. LEGE 06113]|uniref:class I adenylate-forming enzyme family protein n=1 Tax=Cyanobium sp. LEGE 06113 TaxID=1297573 RepID=UPI001880352A|nr:AMP-binding protein [Cyanobium sp. LEGE 06113]MBE9155063.1 AMP-binding protein [Cyanobium sp. LEGE 06113]